MGYILMGQIYAGADSRFTSTRRRASIGRRTCMSSARTAARVLITLGDEETPPALWRNHHMREPDAREALRIVEENQEPFREEWRRLHGA